MEAVKKWFNNKTAESVVHNLQKNGFKASYFESSTSALSYIETLLINVDNIGFGGSMTILNELNIDKMNILKGKTIFNHNDPSLTLEEKQDIRIKELTCDLFITSSNAVTKDGKIVNIDGIGNRVNAMSFGPKKSLIIVGINKIVGNVDEGIKRIKTIVSPMNAKRLSVKTPCAETGVCSDCNSPQRICRIVTIIEKRPNPSDIEVIIIGENLGY